MSAHCSSVEVAPGALYSVAAEVTRPLTKLPFGGFVSRRSTSPKLGPITCSALRYVDALVMHELTRHSVRVPRSSDDRFKDVGG